MSTRRKKTLDPASFTAESLYQTFRDIFTPEILEKAGIPLAVLKDPDTKVALGDHCKLLEIAAVEHGNPNLGLYIGTSLNPSDIGTLGYTILNAPTVEVALRSFVRYLHVYALGCDMELKVSRGKAEFIFTYSIVEPDLFGRRQEAECTLAMVKRLIEVAIGQPFNLKQVCFEHPEPPDIKEHKRVFGLSPNFGERENSLVFDSKQLLHETRKPEIRLFEVLESHLAEALKQIQEEKDIVAQVGTIVAQSLSHGVPNIDFVAEKLCMTKRTLQRRLSERDKLYNEYADDIRQRMARQYVSKTDLPLTEVAFLLGYAHVSAFSRAFRRWTGKTPNEFRGVVDSP